MTWLAGIKLYRYATPKAVVESFSCLQRGNMNGLLAALRIYRAKVNILINSMPRSY